MLLDQAAEELEQLLLAVLLLAQRTVERQLDLFCVRELAAREVVDRATEVGLLFEDGVAQADLDRGERGGDPRGSRADDGQVEQLTLAPVDSGELPRDGLNGFPAPAAPAQGQAAGAGTSSDIRIAQSLR